MDPRFVRHNLIPGWDQSRLEQAVVVCIGMGAIGNETARILAMGGVGTLILCDPDSVEESNLSRTLLFRTADLGRPKVEAAADALIQLNPALRVHKRPWPLVQGVGLAELRDASLVLGGLDSRWARLQLSGRCQMVNAVYIDGGTDPWGGEVHAKFDPDGPCYGCALSPRERAESDMPWSCAEPERPAELGVSAFPSALVGAWMAMVAIRFLLGLPSPKGIMRVDGIAGTTGPVSQTRDPDCLLHTPIGAVRKIPVGNRDTVGFLRKQLPGLSPLAWHPMMDKVECLRCGWREQRWGLPAVGICPTCHGETRARTTLELAKAPDHLALSYLGVAPREILAVRGPQGMEWVELAE